jgi:thiosulfate/3-mercaptopyruvate sulfurtransferase
VRVQFVGHVPGASFLDVDSQLAAEPSGRGRHPLPDAETFAESASRAGIGEGVLVVAYGSMGGAERLWWLLRHFGHDDCAVLLGGIDVWGGPLRSGDEVAEARPFSPRSRTGDTIEADEIAARLGDERLVVVDTRVASRWRGEPNSIDRVPGRVPGALNAPWSEPLPTLPETGELAAYCGSGITSCVLLHRLWLAGRDARLYPGSWSEWEGLGLPIERDATAAVDGQRPT